MEDELIAGRKYRCTCKQAWSGKVKTVLLIRVDEDDCDWRTADDNSEFNEINWDVTSSVLMDTLPQNIEGESK